MNRKHLTNGKWPLLAAGSMIALSTFAGVAQAQETTQTAQAQTPQEQPAAASAPKEQEGRDVVVITAEKRETNLQETPIAISAFTGEKIEDTGARSIVDIQMLAAGLNFGQERSGLLRTSVRGISSNVGTESAVATHLDGVYLSNRYDQSGAFFDVSRVEVLRGPQGTLYGRNATGGVINIITNSPTDAPEAAGKVTFGNYGLVESEGFVSGPISGDDVKGRLAFRTSSLPGYGRNLQDGQHVNGADQMSVRTKLDWDVTDTFTANFEADYSRNQSTYADEVSRIFPGFPLQPENRGQTLATGFDSNRNRPNNQDAITYGASVKLQWDLGPVALTSLSAMRRVNKEGAIDIDASPEDAGYFKINKVRNMEKTQELSLASTDNSPLQWIVGGFYLDNDLSGFNDVPLPLLNSGAVRPEIFSNLIEYRTKAWALYGQATYSFTDQLDLTVGGRYSEEKNSDLETRQVLPGAQTTLQQENKSSSFTPRVTAQWKLSDDLNVYATYAKGFKSGGFNPGGNDPSNFRPEKVTNYEIGIKSTSFDDNLVLNLAAFSMDYNDLQVNTSIIIPPGIPAIRVVNAATAKINGVEADFRAYIGDNFSIDGNAAWLDAKYKDFASASDNVGPTTFPFDVPLAARARDASGNRMAGAPELSANIGAQYVFDISDVWTASIRGEYSYQSRVYYTVFEDLRGISQDPAGIFNARLEFDNHQDGWNFALWGRNLTDEMVVSNMIEGSDGAFTGAFRGTTYRPPLTYGVTIAKTF